MRGRAHSREFKLTIVRQLDSGRGIRKIWNGQNTGLRVRYHVMLNE